MANSSSKHLFNGMNKRGGLNIDRWVKMGQAAWEVYDLIDRCPIPCVAYENPVMLRYAQIMSELEKLPCQTVQPWWFGDDEDGPDNEKKATCWWTQGGLPKLARTGTLDGKTARERVFTGIRQPMIRKCVEWLDLSCIRVTQGRLLNSGAGM